MEQQPTIIDMLFDLLEQLILPNWSDLILLLPWVLVGLVGLWLLWTALQWRRAGSRNRSRVPRPVPGSPPPGVHLPGPSRWPFVVPIGAVLVLFAFALPARDARGNPTEPASIPLLVIGLLVSLIAVAGWLLDAMREWRRTAAAESHGALHGEMHTTITLPAHPSRALIPAPPSALVPVAEPAYPEPPAGVHMPGPSPWPFFAPIALTVMLLGLIFSPVLLVGGLILGIIAAAGWFLDAGHEYFSTEEVGHPVPKTRDPLRAWPNRLVGVFAGVIAAAIVITLAPVGFAWLNSLTPAQASPTPVTVPAVPEISASTAVSFETRTLTVPASRPFDLVFHNNQAGVPHNVDIGDSAASPNNYLDGEVITGPATITYHVPALRPGDYYFQCKIHPNMNGTVNAVPESGPPASGSPPGVSPSP
jgi:plastocyanin